MHAQQQFSLCIIIVIDTRVILAAFFCPNVTINEVSKGPAGSPILQYT